MSANPLGCSSCTTGGTFSRRWVVAALVAAVLGVVGLALAGTDNANDLPKSNLQTTPSAKAEAPAAPDVQVDDASAPDPENQGANAANSGTPTGHTGDATSPNAALGTPGTMSPRVAPSNDSCSAAIVIPAGPYPIVTTPVDITDATTSSDPAFCATTGNTIWYSFTPATSGAYIFTTCAASGATGSTVKDTVLALFTSTGGACPAVTSVACNDTDSGCLTGAGFDQSSFTAILTGGQTYFVVAGLYTGAGMTPIVPGNENVAIRVNLSPAPINDTCAGAVPLTLNRALEGTTASANNDYQSPSTTACFSGVGQTPTTSPGRDVVYSFTAPAAGKYSFRMFGQNYPSTTVWDTVQNSDLYVASDCPASGSVSCLGGANRMVSASSNSVQNRGEEVSCLSLAAAQTVYVYVDQAAALTGHGFSIEAYPCNQEAESNGTPATANAFTCPATGSISPAGDVDFWNLGTFNGDERLYGIVDGITANSNDYNLRITNDTDTLEFDEGDGISIIGGSNAPQWAGTPATAGPVYLRVNQNAGIAAEPYRIQSLVEPDLSNAANEPPEPNNSFAGAGSSPGNYFSGFVGQVAADLDVYRICADAGDLIFVGVDADPTRDGSSFNPGLFAFQYNGAQIFGVSDANSASNQTPSPGVLNGLTPNSPSEVLTWRARYTGVYFPSVNGQAPLTVGDYAMAIGVNCQNPVRSGDPQIAVAGPTGSVATSALVTYTVTVTNPGTMAQNVRMVDVLPSNLTFVSLSAFGSTTSGLSCTTPAVGASGTVNCNNFCMAGGDTLTYTLVVQVRGCIGSGVEITNNFSLFSSTTDTDSSNNTGSTTFTTTDDGTCSDNDACTAGDHCEGTSCVTTGPTDCDDHSVCTEDSCDSATGCVHDPTPGLQCNDGFPCTIDSCDPITGCTFPPKPAGTQCNDFFPCTLNDACDGAGNCTGPQKNCDDANSCTADSCETPTGNCIHTPLASGSACEDGNPCTTGDTCGATANCLSGSGTLNCDDNNPCTDDSCDPAVAGGCVHTNNTAACNDGDACTTNDTCGGGTCNGGAPLVCNDGNGCTTDSCNPATGCVYTNNTNPCDDGNACTTGDTCGGGVCNPGGPTNCDDGNCCTIDSCNPATGCVYTPNTAPPVFTVQPSLGACAVLWPPQHGYADFTVENTGAAATSQCGIASIAFASCSSSQPENGTGVGDGNSIRDCVYEPGALHLRAERDGACSPSGRVYSSSVVAVDVCGNTATSDSFDVGVWHDRGHAPTSGTVYSASPGSGTNDTRAGMNGTYGAGCGAGSSCVNGSAQDTSDANPEMEIDQQASVTVNDLNLERASGGNVKLTWTEPEHQPGVNVTRYHVYYLDPVTLFWTQLAEVSQQTRSYQDPVLNDGRFHMYKVTAVIK